MRRPKRATPVELGNPGYMQMVHPSDPVLDEPTASLPALAALCLAVRGDAASLLEIRALATRSSGRDLLLCERVLARLARR